MNPLATYPDLAQTIDHSLLAPELNNVQVINGLELARRYEIACAVVRPCDLDVAVRTLAGSQVRPGSVAGFPHGSQNTATKIYETRDLLRRGAREIDVVIAVSKLLSREFQYVQTELDQISDACRQANAIMKVTLETGWLTEELKIIACRCCERAETDFVQTASGFGAPATLDDIRLLRKYLPEEIGVKAGSGIGTLDEALAAREAGASRLGGTATADILDAWKVRLSAPATV